MKLKIISDGTTEGTAVVDAVTGEPLQGVQILTFMCSPDEEQTEAILHLSGVACELLVDAKLDLVADAVPYDVQDLRLSVEELLQFFDK